MCLKTSGGPFCVRISSRDFSDFSFSRNFRSPHFPRAYLLKSSLYFALQLLDFLFFENLLLNFKASLFPLSWNVCFFFPPGKTEDLY